MLHFVDDVATRRERFRAMARTHAHPHGHLAELEVADPVDASGMLHAELRDRFGNDAFALAFGQRRIRFVLEPSHRAALVVVTHPAFERRVAAARRVGEGLATAGRVDRRRAEGERLHQPPATGGMKTTRSFGFERRRPVTELFVHGDSQHRERQGEAVLHPHFFVQFGRRRGRRFEAFLAAAGLLAQHGKILERDLLHAFAGPPR